MLVSYSIQFDLKSDLAAFFLNQDLLITETHAPDFMNRRLTSLWVISQQEKTFIITDASISNRLNLKTPLYVNPNNTIIPVIENKRKISFSSVPEFKI